MGYYIILDSYDYILIVLYIIYYILVGCMFENIYLNICNVCKFSYRVLCMGSIFWNRDGCNKNENILVYI